MVAGLSLPFPGSHGAGACFSVVTSFFVWTPALAGLPHPCCLFLCILCIATFLKYISNHFNALFTHFQWLLYLLGIQFKLLNKAQKASHNVVPVHFSQHILCHFHPCSPLISHTTSSPELPLAPGLLILPFSVAGA